MGEVTNSVLRLATVRAGEIELAVVDEVPDGAAVGGWSSQEPMVTIRARVGGEFLWQQAYPVGGSDVGANCLRAAPEPTRALLVTGGTPYYIDVRTGDLAVALPIQEVSIVTDCSTERWLIVASSLSLIVIGKVGPLWLLDRLSWDGLQHLSVMDGRLRGHRWDVETDAWAGFEFDLISGRLTGGIATPGTVTRVVRLCQ